MQIDAHQHFWNYDPGRHHWMDESMRALKRDYMPEELQTLLRAHNMDGCIAVQVDQTPEETHFLLDLAAQYPFIMGVVGWVDFQNSRIEEMLESLRPYNRLKGFRHIVQGEPDPNFLLGDLFLRGISFLKPYGYTYDILVYPHQLGAVLEFVRRFGDQHFVIDHLAKPYIRNGFFDGWATLMKAIARYPNVCCKLSGMITEADHGNWTPQQIVPYMELALEAFGPGRILYGSDWPVCLTAGNYSGVKELVDGFISKLSKGEQEAIMGGNAIRFYQLETGMS